MSTPAVGFIGLGNMGSAMATRLLEAGFDVTVYNRSPGKAEALAEVVDPLMPVLDALGQRTFRVSDVAAVGNVVKLSANFLLANVIESLGEAVALVSKAGVDRRDYIDIITSTLFSAPAYETYGGLIAREEFEPAGFAARLGIKDIRLVLAAAEELEVPLPIASLLRDRFLALLASGGGDLDWSAISTLAQRDAGL